MSSVGSFSDKAVNASSTSSSAVQVNGKIFGSVCCSYFYNFNFIFLYLFFGLVRTPLCASLTAHRCARTSTPMPPQHTSRFTPPVVSSITLLTLMLRTSPRTRPACTCPAMHVALTRSLTPPPPRPRRRLKIVVVVIVLM